MGTDKIDSSVWKKLKENNAIPPIPGVGQMPNPQSNNPVAPKVEQPQRMQDTTEPQPPPIVSQTKPKPQQAEPQFKQNVFEDKPAPQPENPNPSLKDITEAMFGTGEETPEPETEKEPTPEEPATSPVEQEETEGEDAEDKVSIAENYKKLRKRHKEIREERDALKADLETKQKKLTEYETGAIVPEVIQEKETEIDRLRHYERLHDLKSSKEYRQKFAEPIAQSLAKIDGIAEEYGIDQQRIRRVFAQQTIPDLNRFLTDELGLDELAASDIRNETLRVMNLNQERTAAERDAAQSLTRLQEEFRQREEAQEIERRSKIRSSAKETFTRTMLEIQQENKIPELVTREADEDHNKRVVIPLRQRASTEFANLIKEFEENGIKQIPPPLMTALCKLTLLSIASGVAVSTREQALAELAQKDKALQRTRSITRPKIGGSNGGVGGPPPEKYEKLSPTEAARLTINSVLSRNGK